jgi:hypothetical protein
MRSTLAFLFFFAVTSHAADASAAPSSPPASARPHTVTCQSTVNIWVEIDDKSLPARGQVMSESRKRVLLHLVNSTPSRGETVVCSYATRDREVTSSYYVRCLNPRKERGMRHTYACR